MKQVLEMGLSIGLRLKLAKGLGATDRAGDGAGEKKYVMVN